MNKKRGKVTTANESCWWRRAWRWGTWKRLVNASETSWSQKGNMACFHIAQQLLKLTAIMLCGWHCFSLVPYSSHSLVCFCACLMWYGTEWCSERPPSMLLYRVLQSWSLAVVKAVSLAAWVELMLFCWVCLVSGTSLSIRLLLSCLFFLQTTP